MTEWKWPAGTTSDTKLMASQFLWALALEGDVEDPHSGSASRLLFERVQRLAGASPVPNHVRWPYMMERLADPEGPYGRAFIGRDMGPKRCYAIRLLVPREELPPNPFPSVAAPVNGQAPPSQQDEDDAHAADEPYWDRSPRASDEASERPLLSPVLERLLVVQTVVGQSVLEILRLEAELAAAQERAAAAEAAPPNETDDEVRQRLAGALEANKRLVRKLRDAEETAVARSKEAQATRQAMGKLQLNLDAALRGDHVPDESGFRRLEALMREKPKVAM
jgi:hypothetical protein